MYMNKKIVTVTLNPCVDLTLTVDKFLYGGTNNVVGTRKDISGKGINTSVVLKNLGIENIATGLMFLEDKDILRDFLEKNKIPNKEVTTATIAIESLSNGKSINIIPRNQKTKAIARRKIELNLSFSTCSILEFSIITPIFINYHIT